MLKNKVCLGKVTQYGLLFVFGIFILSSHPVSARNDTKSISSQASEFLSQSKAMSFKAPLTPDSTQNPRTSQLASTAEDLANIQKTLRISVEKQMISGVTVFVVTPEKETATNSGKAAIYLHGGGFVMGRALDRTALVMADKLGLPVYAVEYRLAPEHPFPAALNDCLSVYRELIQTHEPGNIVVFGGSAGGGLALATMLKARDLGLLMPAALGLSSPVTEISRIGDSLFTNEGRDPILKWEGLMEYFVQAYAGEHDPMDPFLSPVYGGYTLDFPPTLLITGTRDLLLSDSIRQSRVMVRTGVDVDLRVWEGMWHGFDLIPDLPEGEEARNELAQFLLDALANNPGRE